ncbi:MAG: TIGR00374 family protein [Halobacteriales archaeon SW_9_67_25]|jgi:uncharacterized protein (TIRG00374 family)|nr:MAG: TIGR00374 family protein [Halobacteriales archaeon SW_9_67_25]
MDGDRLTTLGMFGIALAVLAVVVWIIGAEEVLGALEAADRSVLPVLLAVVVVWLTAWGLALWTVLRAIGAPVSVPMAVALFAAAVFSNNVTPFGQAGGEPVSGLLISTAADSDYETGLAAIASVDTLHFLPSIGLGIVGLVYLLAGAVELTEDLLVATVGVVVLVSLIVTAATLGWRYRDRVRTGIVGVVTPVAGSLGGVIPGRSPPGRADIEQRVDGFFLAVGRVANSRRTVAFAMGCSALGWTCLAGALWLSLYALGHSVPFAAVLFVVPVGSIAGVTPLPGGLGGLEAAFITLLVPTTGLPASVATAGVLIYRGATYWLPVLVGGGVATVLGSRARQ